MDGQCGKCPMKKRLCADPQMEKGPEYCSTLLYGEALEKADRLYAEENLSFAAAAARQEASCGITHILAPVLDISRDSRMGRQGETYGEDPALASALGAAYTRGAQSTETDGRKPESVATVSYTHLDVYKRQPISSVLP